MTHLKLMVIIEKEDDGFFTVVVPELKNCYTQTKTIDKLLLRIREVIKLCVEEEGIPEPKELVGVQQKELDVG